MPKRYVSIWFPYLQTDWFTAKRPELKSIPFVLKASLKGRMIITAVNPLAKASGITKGLALADARAIYPTLQDFDDRPTLGAQLLQRIAEWSIRFTPSAAPDLPGGVLLDATGCAHLWGSEDAYLEDITKRLLARGYTARAAMADTIGTAWAVARFGSGARIIKSGGQYDTLLNLPPDALRLERVTYERLRKLGLHTIGDCIAMPRTALRRRFGAPIVQRIEQALGGIEESFTPITPLHPFEERLPCLEPIITRTGIEIALERLLQTLCDRLRKEGKGLRTAYFRCLRIDSTAQGIEIATSRPSQEETHLFHLFSLKIDTLEPKGGIELFMLEATKVEDYIPIQESLWNSGGSVDKEGLSQLVDRITGKFGAGVIHRYQPAEHHLPERSFQEAQSLLEPAIFNWNAVKRLPLQLLPTPQHIEVTAPVPDYPPMNFRYKGTLHTIKKADGPERIEQEWWIQEGEHRDYYCVEDETGNRYWLFRLGHYTGDKSNQWFLHGFFA